MNQTLDAVTLKQGFDAFSAKREEGDIDLIDLIRQALVNNNAQNIEAGYDNDLIILEAKDKQSHIQRYLLNRYWARQLMMLPNTSEVRSYLVQDGPVEAWLRVFVQYVLPYALKNNLPATISGRA